MSRMRTVAAVGLFMGFGVGAAWSADIGRAPYSIVVAPELVDTSVLPACDDPAVTGSVARQFAATEQEYWNSDARIVGFEAPYEVSYGPQQAQITVDARRGWQPTGIVVRGPGTLRIRASGRWSFNPAEPAVTAAGARRLSTFRRPAYAYSGPGGREGQLIGRIGDGPSFVVGSRVDRGLPPAAVGPLYLSINDDLAGLRGAGLADNAGALDVTVGYRGAARPAADSALFTSAGLYRPWGPDFIIRRFCGAEALVVAGEGAPPRQTAAYYMVVDGGGFAGIGWKVHWCVVGYDRNFAYEPLCKMMKP